MRIIKHIAFIAIAAVVFFGCRSSKRLSSPEIDLVNMDAESLFEVIDKNSTKFQNFSANYALSAQLGSDRESLSGQIRISDDVIWVSIGKFGFEGLRAMITKDSIQILNKIDKSYDVYSLSFFDKYLGSAVDFSMLKNILTGNTFFSYDPSFRSDKEENGLRIYSQMPNSLSKSMLVDVNEMTVNSIKLGDFSGMQANIQYLNRKKVNDELLPHEIEIEANVGQRYAIKISYSKININDPSLSFPFQVPASYR